MISMLLGHSDFRNKKIPIHQLSEDRFLHTGIFGRTGTGKSSLMLSMAASDIGAGKGVVLIDPHGDLSNSLLEYVPSYRANETIYFSPADFPIGLNVLEPAPDSIKHLIISSLVSIFKSMWPNHFLHVQEQLLRKSSETFMGVGGYSLLDIPKLLTNAEFRNEVVQKLHNLALKDFWLKQFNTRKDEYRIEYITPLLNKIDQFASAKPVADCLRGGKKTVSFEKVRESSQVFIANLSGIGRQEAKLLGNLIVTKLFLEAAKIRNPEERREQYIYADEFGNFATDIVEDILSEARKLRLALIFAAQFSKQLPDSVIDAAIGNLGHLVLFGVGSDDAERFRLEVAPEFSPLDLINRPNYSAVFRLTMQGQRVRPFSGVARTRLDKTPNALRGEAIKRNIRMRFGQFSNSYITT